MSDSGISGAASARGEENRAEGGRCGGIIPIPVACEAGEGVFALGERVEIEAPPALEREVLVLARWLERGPGGKRRTVAVVTGRSDTGAPRGAGQLDDTGAPTRGGSGVARVVVSIEAEMRRAEEYRLDIGAAEVRLAAADAAGVVRGAASLAQLALSDGASIPELRIRDWPRFSWRGLMLDCARNFFRVEFIEKLIDLAALHKLNVFHWHLTDDQAWRVEIPSHPELTARGAFRQDLRYEIEWRKGGFYRREDVARIVEYASARHILVVPEIESPGHSTALLASHPEFSCRGSADASVRFEPQDHYGIFEDIACAGSDALLSFYDEVLGELCAMFRGGYVHMGGDEAPKARWLACPSCRRRMAELGLRDARGGYAPERLQAWFMSRLSAMLRRKGARMAAWDEVVEGGIDTDTLVMSWRGPEPGIEAAKLGYDVVMCPQTKACYLDHKHLDEPEEPGHLGVCTVRDSYSFDPVPPDLPPEAARHILGGQANLWSELLYFGRQAEYMLFPRLCALSEAFWSPRGRRSFEDFSARLEPHRHRLDALDVLQYRGKLS